jgi:hypothetical protein
MSNTSVINLTSLIDECIKEEITSPLSDASVVCASFDYCAGVLRAQKGSRALESLQYVIGMNDPLCNTLYFKVMKAFIDTVENLTRDSSFNRKTLSFEGTPLYKSYLDSKKLIDEANKIKKGDAFALGDLGTLQIDTNGISNIEIDVDTNLTKLDVDSDSTFGNIIKGLLNGLTDHLQKKEDDIDDDDNIDDDISDMYGMDNDIDDDNY